MNHLLFPRKKRERETNKAPCPFCQMKALQRWLSLGMLLFEFCRTLFYVALLRVHQRMPGLLKVKTSFWCLGDLWEGIRSLGEEHPTLCSVWAGFKETIWMPAYPSAREMAGQGHLSRGKLSSRKKWGRVATGNGRQAINSLPDNAHKSAHCTDSYNESGMGLTSCFTALSTFLSLISSFCFHCLTKTPSENGAALYSETTVYQMEKRTLGWSICFSQLTLFLTSVQYHRR